MFELKLEGKLKDTSLRLTAVSDPKQNLKLNECILLM